MSGTVPPMATRSDMANFPDGFKSARTGTFFPMRSKSSMVISTPAEWALSYVHTLRTIEKCCIGFAVRGISSLM